MTRLLFIKLLRDLRGTWGRIVLMIIAISLTLVVFSAVLYTWGITTREISRGFLSTNPASATILLEWGLDANQMAAIVAEARTRPGIIDAILRTQFTLQIQQKDGGWGPNPLQIFVAAPGDPMRMQTFSVEQGSWPPATGDILIERGALKLFNLHVGDTLIVKAPNGQPASLRISGVAYNAALAPSFQEQKGNGYISTASLPLLGAPVALDELKIQVADQSGSTMPSRDRDAIVATASDLAGWLQQTYGVTVREIQVPAPYTHPHQRQADLLLLALLVFSGAGLLLSAILVATMLNGLFAQQIPQIGIMKAIGARSSRMLQLYLLMTLFVGVTATVLAFIPGIAISRVSAPAILTVLLDMNTPNLAIPWWMYGVVIAAGIGIPLLFALAPLVRTSRTTVREALDYRGVDRQGDNATRFDAGLGRMRGLDRTVLMAFRNIFRRRARFLLSVGLLASAGTVFIAGISIMGSVQAVPERAKDQRPWDVEIQLANTNQTTSAALTTLVEGIPGVRHGEAWTSIPTAIAHPGQISITRTYPDQGHGSMVVSVIPPDSSLMQIPPLLEGRWLQPGETGAVVINQSVRKDAFPDVHSGDTIQLSIGGRPTNWRVVGLYEFTFGSASFSMTAEGWAEATGGNPPNALRIVTDRHDEATRTAVANAAERALTDAGIVVRSAASVSRFDAAGIGHMLPIILIFLALAIAMGVVGCVGLASTVSTNVLERTREFGVMRAIGASAATVRRLVIAEGIFIALVSCIVAAIPTLLLTAVMGAGFGNMFLYAPLPFQISVPATLIWIVVVVLGAALATLAPASRASRLTVRQALAYL
jgi:putative ABC transport system permease protein